MKKIANSIIACLLVVVLTFGGVSSLVNSAKEKPTPPIVSRCDLPPIDMIKPK